MKFLLNHHQILLFFLLVPLLIHLFKRMQAKQIIVSSLYLLRRKKANLSQKLKLRQLTLLMVRCLIVLSLAGYFLRPVLQEAPTWVQQLLPYEDRLTVLLDNRWDDRDSMISKWYKMRGDTQAIDVEFITLYENQVGNNLIEQVNLSLKTNASQNVLFSRFYGISSEEMKELSKLPLQFIPFGPNKVDNRGILGAYVQPKVAYVGEEVKVVGSVHTNSSSELSTKLTFFENEKIISEKDLFPSILSPSNFAFSMIVKSERSKAYKLKIPEDILNADDEVNLKLDVKSSFTVILVDDEVNSSQRNSRLYFIRKFLESLKAMFPKVLVRLTDMDSKLWENSTEKPDWLILGSLKHFTWKNDAKKVLIFPQKDRAIQTQIDQKLSIKSYAIESLPREVEFPTMDTEDRGLYSTPWQIYRYLQLKQEEGIQLAVAGKEVLFFRNKDVYFSAFDFSKYDFSGVAHPYFPVFLYQLFFDRFPIKQKNYELNSDSFERPNSILFSKNKGNQNMAKWSDLSKVLILLFIICLLAEVYLVKNIQALTNSKLNR